MDGARRKVRVASLPFVHVHKCEPPVVILSVNHYAWSSLAFWGGFLSCLSQPSSLDQGARACLGRPGAWRVLEAQGPARDRVAEGGAEKDRSSVKVVGRV